MKVFTGLLMGSTILVASGVVLSADLSVAGTVVPQVTSTVEAHRRQAGRALDEPLSFQAPVALPAPGAVSPFVPSGDSGASPAGSRHLGSVITNLGNPLTSSGLIVPPPSAESLNPVTEAIGEEAYTALARCSIRASGEVALDFQLPVAARAGAHAFEFAIGVTCPEGVRYQLATERGNGVQRNADTLRASSYQVEIHAKEAGQQPESAWVLLVENGGLLAEGAHEGNGHEKVHAIKAVLLENPFSTQGPRSAGELKPLGMTALFALEQIPL